MRIQLLEFDGLSCEQLMQYGWISGDHNPIHFDEKVAKQRGLPKLIVHGMYLYCIAYRGVDTYLQKNHKGIMIQELSAKFSGMTFVGDQFTVEMELDDSVDIDAKEARHKVFLVNHNKESNCIFTLKCATTFSA